MMGRVVGLAAVDHTRVPDAVQQALHDFQREKTARNHCESEVVRLQVELRVAEQNLVQADTTAMERWRQVEAALSVAVAQTQTGTATGTVMTTGASNGRVRGTRTATAAAPTTIAAGNT